MVHLGALVEQHEHGLVVAALRRERERREARDGAQVDAGAAREQLRHDLGVAVLRRHVQRRVAVLVRRVDGGGGAALAARGQAVGGGEQLGHHVRVARRGCREQLRLRRRAEARAHGGGRPPRRGQWLRRTRITRRS